MEKSEIIHIFDKNGNLRNLSLLVLLGEMFQSGCVHYKYTKLIDFPLFYITSYK